jgi:hypothetical protein
MRGGTLRARAPTAVAGREPGSAGLRRLLRQTTSRHTCRSGDDRRGQSRR